jgi:hypothetical protein
VNVIAVLLAAYVTAVCGYVVARLIASRSSARILLGFAIWNTAIATLAGFGARYLMRMSTLDEGSLLTLTLISASPHLLVLGGNIALFACAFRMGTDRGFAVLLGSWVLASMLTIALLGAVSPLTLMLNLLFR